MMCPYHHKPVPYGETCHRCECAGITVVECELDKVDRVRSTCEQEGQHMDHSRSRAVLVFVAKPPPQSPKGDIMPKINGKFYRCDCGANVFRYTDATETRLKCNGCGATYSVE